MKAALYAGNKTIQVGESIPQVPGADQVRLHVAYCGICGTDHAGSLLWLSLDNEVAEYVKRVARGLEVDAEKVAAGVDDRDSEDGIDPRFEDGSLRGRQVAAGVRRRRDEEH